MPELPEVETVRRELAPWLAGRKIVSARRGPDAPAGPKYARLEQADGQTIEAVTRRGKFLVLPLSGGDELVIHLGMTGTLSPVAPADHLRVVLELAGRGKKHLYFRDPRRFGRFLLAPAGDRRALPTLAKIGPEPLEPGFTADVLAAGLARSAQPVKAVLLGQRAVAGVGNIYADEALWRARVHPEAPARDLPRARVAALHAAIVEVLAAAVAGHGTTLRDYRRVDGTTGGYAIALQVYGRDGEPCPRCGRELARLVVGQRGTTFCPACQRLPRADRR
ncbi:MAG: bifunctional DNA-formamidopyrimidine glycosylase/DNA-(apurinic or apyrimidinic site) lyase [Deltaproteobacteria bacterium]|nr:bifunctional DNA-formamidopyrimidine glycosylase/DNA-(apurinic or apyrimidinic site) lyase [Deltaproteobacteria bacterium]